MSKRSFFACFGSIIWRAPRVLWVCRVPAISALGGGLFVASLAQTRDMFADLGLAWGYWALFFLITLGWAWIVHWAGRHVLRLDDWVPEAHVPGGISPQRRADLQEIYKCAAIAIPRLLGVAVFVFMAIAMVRAYRNLEPAQALPEVDRALRLLFVLIAVTIILGTTFFFLVWRRRRINIWLNQAMEGKRQHWPLTDGPLLTGEEAIFLDFRRLRTNFSAAAAERTAWVDVIIFAIAIAVTVLFLFSLVLPHSIASVLPRAVFVPFVLGSSILLFTEIGAYAMRWRAPLLLLFIVAGGILEFLVGQFHDVRWVERAGGHRQISIQEAVKQWQFANECPDIKNCPRPIIIAGSGGGSRAAFMTATVVGAILDLSNPSSADFRDVRKRIFALSTVSGSSVAAAVITAALRDAEEVGSPDRPPCQKGPVDFAWLAASENNSETASWRDCLQKILAGDLLSPVLVGLIYRDTFPMGNPVTGQPWWSDRAVLLEQALERRYTRVVTGAAGICAEEDTRPTGLCRHFGYHPVPSDIHVWHPLVFINGTSVETGQRIIASQVAAASPRPKSQKSLFPLAYDLCEIRSAGPCTGAETKSDVMLSTAFTMSARFPIISPHGILRARVKNTYRIVDRIVDGGYFENDGLATGADVADALKEFGLHPLIILITNDPEPEENGSLPPPRMKQSDQPDLLLPRAEDSSLFEDYTVIGRALFATRSGHENGDVEYAKSVVGRDQLFHVTVRNLQSIDGSLCRRSLVAGVRGAKITAAMQDVSLSWWMSQPEQAFLDYQLCDKGNSDQIITALRASASTSLSEK